MGGVTGQTGTCTSNAADVTEDVGATYSLIAQSPSQESNMLAQIQESPMSICVDAQLWQTYQGGVITSSSGCGTQLDHAVQATGYNAEGNYWIVRNSWGESWGENGFVWVEYGITFVASPVKLLSSQLRRSRGWSRTSWCEHTAGHDASLNFAC